MSTVETIQKDYPQGDGEITCTICLGRGVVRAPKKGMYVGERTQPCLCVEARDIKANVERGWRGLLKAPRIESSPLMEQHLKDLWITCQTSSFRSHLRHIALRMGSKWHFQVVSDADLMDSWLARIDDDEVYDADVGVLRRSPVTSKYGSLVDLIEPPSLLILVLGVKAARNSAMPEVLLEVLRHRAHVDKPTWVVDEPEYPLASGHISYDSRVGQYLSTWHHIRFKKDKAPTPSVLRPGAIQQAPTGMHVEPLAPRPQRVIQTPPSLIGVPLESEEEDTEVEDVEAVQRTVRKSTDTRSELDDVMTESAPKWKKSGGWKK